MKILMFSILWVGTLAIAYFVGRAGGGSENLMGGNDPVIQSSSVSESLVGSGGRSRMSSGKQDTKIPAPKMLENDDHALLNTALNSHHLIERLNALTTFLGNLGPHNIDETLAAFEKDGRRGKEWEISLLVYSWAKFDGPAALAHLEEKGGLRAQLARYSALSAWGKVDADGAIAYAKENGKSDEDDNFLLAGVITGLLDTNIQRAGRMLYEDLSYGRVRGQTARKFVDALVDKGGFAAADSWLQSIPSDNDFKKGASGLLARRLAAADPKQAAEWALGLDASVQRRGVSAVAGEWGSKDPAAAAKWVDSLPENVRSVGIESVVSEWAVEDSAATAEWLNQYPASPDMDQPVQTFSYAIEREDPESAVSWASSITDESARVETVTEVARNWARRDREAAKAFFENAGDEVPASVKEMLGIGS